MKKLLATLILTGLASTASAAGIHVHDAWARSTVEGMEDSGAFMTIHNDNKTQDFLVGGNTPIAKNVEVHTHTNDNGVMRMRPVEGGMPLELGENKLQPGGYHIMFKGLKRQLKVGDRFPLTLKFKSAKSQTIEVVVKLDNKPAGDHNHGHNHEHKHEGEHKH